MTLHYGTRQWLTAPTALLLIGLLTALPGAVLAERSNTYRAEFLLFQRLSPDLIQEDISTTRLDFLPEYGVPLWVDSGWESRFSDAHDSDADTPNIRKLPTANLRLAPVRDSLERSGRYEVLEFSAWQDDFPHGYQSTPIVIDLEEVFDGERAIKGSIRIERRRYLHVHAQLYDLRPRETDDEIAGDALLVTDPSTDPLTANGPMPLVHGSGVTEALNWEVSTWLREMRRMRSEEVHYLDSPTIGLLVYFHPIDN